MNEIIRKGRMAEIVYENKFSTRKERAIIDIEDLERVKKHFWSFSGTTVSSSPDMLSATFGQFIMNVYKNKKRKLVLHKNGNPLDCRKSNLVVGTRQQLSINSKLQSNNTSGHKGVCWCKTHKKWCASLVYNGIKHSGGSFVEKEKAIESRKRLEEIYHNHLKFFPREDNRRTE